MFYNGLTVLDGSLTPQPSLAEEFTTQDAKTWVFKLRKGVTFHDGKPLTPADVVYLDHAPQGPGDRVEGQGAGRPDRDREGQRPQRGDVRLTSPNADLPVILGTYHFHIVKEGTTDFNAGIGTGPYKVKEFKPGVRSVAVRNENYWKPGRPYLDEIELVGISDESARVNALLAGGMRPGQRGQPALDRTHHGARGKFAVLETKSGSYTDLIMRDDSGPGSNPDFVLAMKYLFNREQMLKTIAARPRRGGQRPAHRPDQPLLLRGPAAARLRSREGQVAPAEGQPRQRPDPGGGVAGGDRLGGDGAGDAAGGQADRPEPGRQAHARRRLLVQRTG